MASRPREAKKLRKLKKALRNTPPTSINLIEYLRVRRYAQTAGEARRLLTDGKVMVGSHVIGRLEVPDPNKPNAKMFVAMPLVDAKHRGEIVVLHGE